MITHAAALLITTEPALADAVGRELEAMAARADRFAIVEQALENCGYVLVDSLAEAAVAVDRIAPEHLSIQVADPLAMLAAVHNAGSIFSRSVLAGRLRRLRNRDEPRPPHGRPRCNPLGARRPALLQDLDGPAGLPERPRGDRGRGRGDCRGGGARGACSLGPDSAPRLTRAGGSRPQRSAGGHGYGVSIIQPCCE